MFDSLIVESTGAANPQLLQGMEKGARDALLQELKHKGCTVRQLSRLTGINRNIIQSHWFCKSQSAISITLIPSISYSGYPVRDIIILG